MLRLQAPQYFEYFGQWAMELLMGLLQRGSFPQGGGPAQKQPILTQQQTETPARPMAWIGHLPLLNFNPNRGSLRGPSLYKREIGTIWQIGVLTRQLRCLELRNSNHGSRDSKSLANRILSETYPKWKIVKKPRQRFEHFLALRFESCDLKSLRIGGSNRIEPRTAIQDI